jgi:hypothetical protein
LPETPTITINGSEKKESTLIIASNNSPVIEVDYSKTDKEGHTCIVKCRYEDGNETKTENYPSEGLTNFLNNLEEDSTAEISF